MSQSKHALLLKGEKSTRPSEERALPDSDFEMSATSEITAGEVRENKNGVWKKQAIMDTLNKMKIDFDRKDKVGDLREQLAKALEAAAEPQA